MKITSRRYDDASKTMLDTLLAERIFLSEDLGRL